MAPSRACAAQIRAIMAASAPAPVATAVVEERAKKVSPEGAAAKAETPAARPASAQTEVAKTVEAWAAAWSRKDVRAYLAHYARDFKTPGGQSRPAWETERRQRIDKPGGIQVTVDDLHVSFDGDQRATVRFRQNYRSVGLKSSIGKTLDMVRRDGRWLIQQERVGG